MKTSQQLRSELHAIDHKSYPAYKSLTGPWSFPRYTLSIDHVQGDPFAAPSRLSVVVDRQVAGFPEECFDTPWRRVALEDLLLRRASRQASRFSHQAKGSGKSGVLAVACPGQEVLERTGIVLVDRGCVPLPQNERQHAMLMSAESARALPPVLDVDGATPDAQDSRPLPEGKSADGGEVTPAGSGPVPPER